VADVRERALHYLRDGAVRVHHAARVAGGPRIPREVVADVVGHRSTYVVTLDDGRWHCTCRTDGCPHTAATQLVTGWPSVAAKPPKEH
jgi:hypothetical protein